MRHHSGAFLTQLGRLLSRGTVTGLSERDLLDRFLAGHDELAFAALVTQHGPMVLGVCRRLLRDEAEIEDAFQATFLVFVRRAWTIRGHDSVGRWLHGVARRVALRARANAASQRSREHLDSSKEPCSDQGSPDGAAIDREMLAILDEELSRLPGSLRTPLSLCYLEGLTHDQVARRLGWPVGTVRSRLARGRETLRRRLTRRGMSVDENTLAMAFVYRPVTSGLLDSTIRLSLAFTTRQTMVATLASATATTLANGVLQAMMISKLKVLSIGMVACVLALGGFQGYAFQSNSKETTKDPIPPSSPALTSNFEKFLTAAIEDTQKDLDQLNRKQQRLEAELGITRDSIDSVNRSHARLKQQLEDAHKEQQGSGQPGLQPTPTEAVEKTFAKSTSPPTPANPPMSQARAPNGAQFHRGGSTGFGGFPRGMGSGVAKDQPSYVRNNNVIMIPSPNHETMTAYCAATGKISTIRLTTDHGSVLKTIPVLASDVGAVHMTGPRIRRIAAFNPQDGIWYPHDLPKPVEKAAPVVSYQMVAYPIGRSIYAFSAFAKRWDVLELPEGKVVFPSVGPETIDCYLDGHLYVFSLRTGTWTDIDTRAVPTDVEEKEKSN